VLIRIFGPKREEVTRSWRKLHNEELHNLYSSPNIVKMIKSRRMRWAVYVVHMGRRGMLIAFWWESQKDGRVILKWILEKLDEVIWTSFI
jgi:hypothetical protein